jgi:hypothetical protein
MPRYHNINGNRVQFTAEEETARDNEETAGDLGQATSRQFINFSVGGGSAECCNGRLMIFEPSNTAIVKNFMSDGCMHTGSNEAENDIVGGFINTTSAIDEINFAFSAGNITSGSISMYGVK